MPSLIKRAIDFFRWLLFDHRGRVSFDGKNWYEEFDTIEEFIDSLPDGHPHDDACMCQDCIDELVWDIEQWAIDRRATAARPGVDLTDEQLEIIVMAVDECAFDEVAAALAGLAEICEDLRAVMPDDWEEGDE